MINIDSDQGRIGELWWINSDPSTTHRVAIPFAGARVHLDLYRWGTCGIGRDIRVAMEPCNEKDEWFSLKLFPISKP